MNYWLLKSEPSDYSFENFISDKETCWEGIRNYQARNFIRDNIKINDEVLFHGAGPVNVDHIRKVIGIDYKDKQEEAINYLNTMGNPYDYVGMDNKGLIGLELGVFGLPETFIVNSKGIITYKHLGPLTKKIITNEFAPFIQ